METKKVLGIIFSLLFVGAFVFVLSWGIINFNKVKDGMSGTGVYTKEDINKSYEDGYNTALTDKEEYTKLIASYRDTITTLNDNISQLNSQVTVLQNNNKDYSNQIDKLNTQKSSLETQVDNLTTIKTNNETTIASLNNQITDLQKQVTNLTNSGEDKSEQITTLNNQITTLQNTVSQLQTTNDMNVATIRSLNTQIANLNTQISDMTLQSQNSQGQINALNNKISELQASVTYYESYIAQLKNGEQIVATFEYDGSVYNIQIVNKGSKLSVTIPTSTTYKIFNGWTVNGSAIDLSTYTITTNTKIVADVTYKYDVKFKVDDTIYNSQIITKNNCATVPTNPTKDGYEFDGWSLNGVDVISDITSKQVTQNVTYTAVFTKLHTVTFVYENETKSTQTIRNGDIANAPTIESTDYKIFNGWTVNGSKIDLSTYKIVTNTTFVADITYKYDVKFKVEDNVLDSQIVAKNNYAIAPNEPTKEHYNFIGWSLNGVDTIDISQYKITENSIFNAIFKIQTFTVIFSVDGTNIGTKTIEYGNVIGEFDIVPKKDNYEFAYWSLPYGFGSIDLSTYVVTKDVTLWANFNKVVFTCKFYDGDTLLGIQEIKKGEKIISAPTPTSRNNLKFLGWSYDTRDDYLTTNISDMSITSDCVFTARYTRSYAGKYKGTIDNEDAYLVIDSNSESATVSDTYLTYSYFRGRKLYTNNGIYIDVSSRNTKIMKFTLVYNQTNNTWVYTKTILDSDTGKVIASKDYVLTYESHEELGVK